MVRCKCLAPGRCKLMAEDPRRISRTMALTIPPPTAESVMHDHGLGNIYYQLGLLLQFTLPVVANKVERKPVMFHLLIYQ